MLASHCALKTIVPTHVKSCIYTEYTKALYSVAIKHTSEPAILNTCNQNSFVKEYERVNASVFDKPWFF